jgi:hypothetical protein
LIKKAPLIMKKLRMTLAALSVIAVVGAALAFKANTKFNQDYCIATSPGVACQSAFLDNSTTTSTVTADQFYWIPKTAADCTTLTSGTALNYFEGN